MKRLLLLGSIFVSCATLAACGGGGSTPNPVPSVAPTITPVSYTAKLVFVGTLAGRTIQSELRAAQSVAMSVSTPVPVMVISNAGQACTGASCSNLTGYGSGTVEAQVSPQPNSTPATTFSQTAPHVLLTPTPSPNPGTTPLPMPSGIVGMSFVESDGTPETQSSGTATVNIGSPVSQTPTTQVYQYLRAAVICIPSYYRDNGASSGWAWNGTQLVRVGDPSQADVYVTGSKCSGAFNVPGDNGTLHFPGGGVVLSTDNPFTSLSASQWTNAQTTADIGTMATVFNGDGSMNAVIIAKTRDGLHTFKMFPDGTGGSAGDEDFDSAIELSGSGVDGF